MLRNYKKKCAVPPIFRRSNVIGQINIIINKMLILNILLWILCRQWLSWNSCASLKTGFPSLWYFARPLRQLTSVVVCLWVFLPLVLSSASEMHAQSGWNQETDWVFLYHEEDPPIIHHCCLPGCPGLFMLLSSPVHSCFLRMWFGQS